MKELLETGVHFGHRTRKWNPKMARYIFTERKGIHIIDLEQTVEMFRRAYYTIRDCVADGGEVLFVGTKKQVQGTIVEEAQRCGAHYVNRRWLGGTLTNFATIRQSIERMKKLEGQVEDGTVDHMPNKEASKLRRELAKLQRNLDGLRFMERKPNLMYIIDPDVETIAVHEANLAGVPIIAIVDTNCDPDPIDLLIPGNDDAIKATKLITARIADAVLEGREGRQDEREPTPAAETKSEDEGTETEEAKLETEAVGGVEEADEAETKEPEAKLETEAVGEVAADDAEESEAADDLESAQADEKSDDEPAASASENESSEDVAKSADEAGADGGEGEATEDEAQDGDADTDEAEENSADSEKDDDDDDKS